MSDKLLFEGDLLLLAGSACLRVWSCAADDLAKSCCCPCGCCKLLSKQLRWCSNMGLLAGGLGLLACAISCTLDVEGLGFNLALELFLISAVVGLSVATAAYQDLATTDRRFRQADDRSRHLLNSEEQAEEAAAGVLVVLGRTVAAFFGVLNRAFQACGMTLLRLERELDTASDRKESRPSVPVNPPLRQPEPSAPPLDLQPSAPPMAMESQALHQLD
eukprot:TRINITY_DN40684_c0_g1_i1.p1 TRINITY_DN40684_c0_g1~~TRINITY_DN40684_c0_g1_i1.p1  ORF type:complete len:218 (+),score=48.77 TRINITY_DN40684_c0_g1_i1:57-710(+)